MGVLQRQQHTRNLQQQTGETQQQQQTGETQLNLQHAGEKQGPTERQEEEKRQSSAVKQLRPGVCPQHG